MLGAEFLARFQGSTDAATTIDPARSYPVRAATEHAIDEHPRVASFARCSPKRRRRTPTPACELGELMYASHASYSACGLGSDGTDRLVALVREAGPAAGLYGAKITGGGSGGTVAVLAAAGRRAVIDAIVDRYRARPAARRRCSAIRRTARAPPDWRGSRPESGERRIG